MIPSSESREIPYVPVSVKSTFLSLPLVCHHRLQSHPVPDTVPLGPQPGHPRPLVHPLLSNLPDSLPTCLWASALSFTAHPCLSHLHSFSIYLAPPSARSAQSKAHKERPLQRARGSMGHTDIASVLVSCGMCTRHHNSSRGCVLPGPGHQGNFPPKRRRLCLLPSMGMDVSQASLQTQPGQRSPRENGKGPQKLCHHVEVL